MDPVIDMSGESTDRFSREQLLAVVPAKFPRREKLADPSKSNRSQLETHGTQANWQCQALVFVCPSERKKVDETSVRQPP